MPQSAAVSTSADSPPLSERRRLGAYYTTETLARVLVEWAVTDSADTVMDASYGGCAFLRQALDHLHDLGSSTGVRQVYGADIDGSTAPWRAKLVSQGVPDRNLHEGDFLLTTPQRELPRCTAAVGNPPYVRHHRLTPEQLQAYEPIRTQTGLSGRASAWAYFVLHSLSFLEPGGRLALLLPGAVLHDGGYAAHVREVLAARCDRVVLVRVAERLFTDALEETVVLLATTGAPTGRPAIVERAQVADVAALAALLLGWPRRPVAAHSLVPAATGEIVERARGQLRRVADVADVRIGIVTGANSFFVRQADDWPADPAAAWVPVVSRSAWLDRLVWTDGDTARCEDRGGAARLLAIDSEKWSRNSGGQLEAAVREAEEQGLDARSHCRRRAKWYALGAVRVPNAFLPAMGRTTGRPVLNRSAATSTNALHHLSWKDSPTEDQGLARVLSGWSSLWQLVGELSGRHYGGGVLKLEPRVAQAMPLWDGDPLDPVVRDLILCARSAADASVVTACADRLVEHEAGLSPQETARLAAAAAALRALRPRSGG